VADPFAGWVHWAGVPLEFVDRIEVVRGGGSGIWGSRALGGVIHILTETPRSTGVRAAVQGGSLGTVRGDVAATYRGERLGVAVMAEHFDTDGFVAVREDLVAPIDRPAGSRHNMAFAKAELALGERLGLHASVSYLDESRAVGTDLRRTGLELGTVRTGARIDAGRGNDVALTLFASDQTFTSTFSTESLDRGREEPSLDQYDVPARAAGAGVQWSNRALAAHEFTAGADLFRVEGDVHEDFRLVNGEFQQRRHVGGQQLLAGVYIQDVYAPAAGVHLLASARYDVAQRSDGFRRETNLANDAVLIDTSYIADTESTVNLSAGVRWEATPRLAWRASAYRAYRSPTLNELYKPFREAGNVLTEGNADLRAERVIGAELGADYALGDAALVRVTGFWARMAEPIVEVTVAEAGATGRLLVPCGFVPAGGVCRQRRNLDAFRSAGVEAELELRPAPAWLLAASWLWNPTEVLRAPTNPELEGNRGARSPEHAFTVMARWTDPSIVDLALTGRWVGRRFEDDVNSLALDPFFVVDARASRDVRRNVQLFAGIENLFDSEYETSRAATGLVRTGGPRMIRGGLRVTL
jgi:outer membrane receptor protein involved in Fe transport